jgi:hypothetical protein
MEKEGWFRIEIQQYKAKSQLELNKEESPASWCREQGLFYVDLEQSGSIMNRSNRFTQGLENDRLIRIWNADVQKELDYLQAFWNYTQEYLKF